jgi:hypothetical protein
MTVSGRGARRHGKTKTAHKSKTPDERRYVMTECGEYNSVAL